MSPFGKRPSGVSAARKGHFHTFPLGKFHSGILSGTDKSAGFFRIWVTVWVRAEN